MAKALHETSDDKAPAETIYMLDGPNLDMLGTRGPRPKAGRARRSGELIEETCGTIRPKGRLPAVQSRRRIDRFRPRRMPGGRPAPSSMPAAMRTPGSPARRAGGSENSRRRGPYQQESRPREFPPSFLHRDCRFRNAFRLRHRRTGSRSMALPRRSALRQSLTLRGHQTESSGSRSSAPQPDDKTDQIRQRATAR